MLGPISDLLARLQSALGDAYRIEKELVGGGISLLFLATEALHRQVVIWLLPREFTSEVSTALFNHEIELAAHVRGWVPNTGEWRNIVFDGRRDAH
jgi:hypothetical protein